MFWINPSKFPKRWHSGIPAGTRLGGGKQPTPRVTRGWIILSYSGITFLISDFIMFSKPASFSELTVMPQRAKTYYSIC